MKEYLCRTSDKPPDDELFRELEIKENGYLKSTHEWCTKCYEIYKNQCNEINEIVLNPKEKLYRNVNSSKKINLLSLYKKVNSYINKESSKDIIKKKEKYTRPGTQIIKEEIDLETIEKLLKAIFNCIGSRIYHHTNCIIDESKENTYNFKHINVDFEHIFFIVQLSIEFIILYYTYNNIVSYKSDIIPIKLKNKKETFENIINLLISYSDKYKLLNILKIREYELNNISYIFDKKLDKILSHKEFIKISNNLIIENIKSMNKFETIVNENDIETIQTINNNIIKISTITKNTLKLYSNKIPLNDIPIDKKINIRKNIKDINDIIYNVIGYDIYKNKYKKNKTIVKSHPKSR
jgi:hypothetical protein